MKIFLDTSSLFKLYHRETDTEDLELIFSTVKITDIFLSEITKRVIHRDARKVISS